MSAQALWASPETVCALIHYAPGASTPGHPHAHAHQHIWIVHGTVVLAGRLLFGGSYVHVPPGVAHSVRALGDHDAVLFQVHQRCGSTEPMTRPETHGLPV